MTPAATMPSRLSKPKRGARHLLAELRQMTRTSAREEGLLNHAQAALVLDVSPRRVGELVQLGILSRFDFLGRTYVSVREVVERRAAEIKAGRPPHSVRERLGLAAKMLSKYDALNAAVDAVTPPSRKPKKK
jgi:hypothetical protein